MFSVPATITGIAIAMAAPAAWVLWAAAGMFLSLRARLRRPTSAISKRNQNQIDFSTSRHLRPLWPGCTAPSQRPTTGPGLGGIRRRRSGEELRSAETVPYGCLDHPDSLNCLFWPHTGTGRLPATDPGPLLPLTS